MTKKELVMMDLPSKYSAGYDTSWLPIAGCDVLPELIHFVMCGKTEAHYKKFSTLRSIVLLESAMVLEDVTEEEKLLMETEYERCINEYNSIIIN